MKIPHRLDVFHCVVQLQSFSKAADALGLTSSMVSQHIAKLEKEVGARLFNRTTRLIALTQAGERLFKASESVFTNLEQALSDIHAFQHELSGTITVNAQSDFGARCLIPLVMQFMQQHPKVMIDVILDDEIRDHAQHGIDLSLTIGQLNDSSYHAVKLGEVTPLLCVSRHYLECHKAPKTLKQAKRCDHVALGLLHQPHSWVFFDKKKQRHLINFNQGKVVHSSQALYAFVKAGAGLGVLLDFIARDDLQKGELVHLLPEYSLSSVGLYAIYQNREHLPARIRTLLEFLKVEIKRLPFNDLI